ncbi:hypothetical protein [Pseudomonas syringae]|uniref:hypothetical protein n=1 Tax=Pseudomonas syringae TaxID=317 RepID=UPI00070E60CC|nr:hypothetical protein [Pseudomonas syringae]
MLGKRVHVVERAEAAEYDDGFAPEWTVELRSGTQGHDAKRIEYVIIKVKNKGAELYSVIGWERTIEKDSAGTSTWTLKLGLHAHIREGDISWLMESYAPGTDLSSAFFKKLEDLLQGGDRAPNRPDYDGVLRSSMSLSEAKLAVSNFYRVNQHQVHITIVG